MKLEYFKERDSVFPFQEENILRNTIQNGECCLHLVSPRKGGYLIHATNHTQRVLEGAWRGTGPLMITLGATRRRAGWSDTKAHSSGFLNGTRGSLSRGVVFTRPPPTPLSSSDFRCRRDQGAMSRKHRGSAKVRWRPNEEQPGAVPCHLVTSFLGRPRRPRAPPHPAHGKLMWPEN